MNYQLLTQRWLRLYLTLSHRASIRTATVEMTDYDQYDRYINSADLTDPWRID